MQRKLHRSLEHALSFNSPKKPVEPLHSTRNNSLTSCLMLEDITMSSSDSGQNPEKDSVTLEETSIKNTDKSSIICDWDPCSYKSKDRTKKLL